MNKTYNIRHSRPDDLPAMLRMLDHSRSIMRANGNTTQWTGGYPSETELLHDIRNGNSLIMEDEAGNPIGTFALVLGLEPTYKVIEDGEWEEDDVPYGTVHRLACMPNQHGIGDACLAYCDRHAPTLRIDTHADNHIMRHLAQRHGFDYRGIVYMTDGTPRMAYQKLLPQHVCHELIDYCETSILPLHDTLDAAHQQPHIRSNIRRSLLLAARHPVNKNMVYCAAAYHDLGCLESRERHHLVSGRMVRHDAHLRGFFSPSQIETIAQAVEDHRASSHGTPRSLYGLILAEADRDLRPEVVVRRTVQFGLAQHPELNEEEQYARTRQHLQEKYGPESYLQLLLPDSPNRADMERLRALIANEERLRAMFNDLLADLRRPQ